MQELNKLETLRDIIDKGEYIVALCGSGMMEECGIHPLKDQDRAYRIEERYGRSPEYLYTDAFFNTRTETFYDFYRNELLVDLEPTASTYTLAAMERAGKLKCIISSNIYELSERSGCHNVINLHGSIYQNHCQKCGKKYSVDYIRQARKVPYCEACGGVIRPDVSFFGEMLDSEKLSSAFMTSIILPFGMLFSVFTGTRLAVFAVMRTVDVIMRLGSISSVFPYSAPLGQLLPE